MGTMINDYSLRYSELSNYMIEQKLCSCLTAVRQCRHCFDPFHKIIDKNDDIPMPPSRARVTGHKINAPFSKRADGNDRMQKGRWRTHLPLVNLKRVTEVDSQNAIFEDGWPK